MPQRPARYRGGRTDTRPSRSNGNLYNDRRWRGVNGLRRQVLREQRYLCAECEKQGRTTIATEVHHLQDHCGNERLMFARSNLVGLCKPCHSAVTASQQDR